MKFLALAVFLTTAVLMTGADASSGVTYASHEKVADALAKGGVLAIGPDLRVQGAHRVTTQIPEMHGYRSHVWYVLDGTATLVTGGTLGGKITTGIVNQQGVSQPSDRRGSFIQGGQTQHLSKGDMIVIPAGTPHWWKEVPQSGITLFQVDIRKPGFSSPDK